MYGYSPAKMMQVSLRNAMLLSQVHMVMCLRFWALAGLVASPIAVSAPTASAVAATPPAASAARSRRARVAKPSATPAEAPSAPRKARRGSLRTV